MTKTEADKRMTEADRDLSEAAWALNDRASTFATYDRVIDRIDAIVRAATISDEHYKLWRAFVAAADKAMIASNYCTDCNGEREVAKPCCSGRDCGCNGVGLLYACPACDGRGWVW